MLNFPKIEFHRDKSVGMDRKQEYLPKISKCFAENGYRGTTTAKLAQACDVRENVLYRVWPSKKEMYLDCVDHIFEITMQLWSDLKTKDSNEKTWAEKILQYQAEDHGLLKYYRLVFAGLMENDPEIRKSLKNLYRRFHEFLRETTIDHRKSRDGTADAADAEISAWALMGVGAMVDIQRELRILSKEQRRECFVSTGEKILGWSAANDGDD